MDDKKLEVCIVDDKLPYTEEIDDSHLINSQHLRKYISPNVNWGEETSLSYLIKILLESDLFKKNQIDIKWATNPNILLNAIKDESYYPNIVIYDWEYGTSFTVPEDSLNDLLNKLKSSFFFIYSSYAQKIPIHLFKKHLNQYADRFQVLMKGDHSYVTSAEEIIFEYISFRVEKNPVIKIGGFDVKIDSSGFLKNYKDILYLDSLLGKASIIQNLEKTNHVLNEETVSSMLDQLNLYFYSNDDESIFTLDNTKINEKRFGILKNITSQEVYKKIGLKNLKQLIEKGTIKV